jgi:uncharacterized membrane protein (UPF0127 family)
MRANLMRPNLMRAVAAGLMLLALPAASQARERGHAASAVTRHPESGLRVIPLTANGHRLAVELAASDKEQEKGLMFRRQMGADEGMIFPMQPPRQVYFWMENTVLPLDIIFIGSDGRVLNVAAHAKPYDRTPIPSAGKAAGVLELNAGRAAELGIGPGSVVKW